VPTARVVLATAALTALLAPAASAHLPPLPVPPVPVPTATIVPTPPVTGPAPGAYRENDGGGFHDILPLPRPEASSPLR
jgi:hypothetical protein